MDNREISFEEFIKNLPLQEPFFGEWTDKSIYECEKCSAEVIIEWDGKVPVRYGKPLKIDSRACESCNPRKLNWYSIQKKRDPKMDDIIIQGGTESLENPPYSRTTYLSIRGKQGLHAGRMVQTLGVYSENHKNNKSRIWFKTSVTLISKFTDFEKKNFKNLSLDWYWQYGEEFQIKPMIKGSVYEEWDEKVKHAYEAHERYVKEVTQDLLWALEDERSENG